MTDRPDFVCVPINLHHDLDIYGKGGQYDIKVVIQKVTKHMDVEGKGRREFENDQLRMDSFCRKNGVKMVDDVRHVLTVTDRIYFDRKMKEVLAKQSKEIQSTFKMPASIEFANNDSIGTLKERVNAYEAQASAASLEYPVLCKLQTGQKGTYSHTFYCVNNR